MGEFSQNFLRELVKVLQRNKIDYIVVGGQAVTEEAPGYTDDLDVLVALSDFNGSIARLKKEPLFGTPERRSWIAKYEIYYGDHHSEHSDVDLLNGRPYSGQLRSDEFFDHIRSQWTMDGVLGPGRDLRSSGTLDCDPEMRGSSTLSRSAVTSTTELPQTSGSTESSKSHGRPGRSRALRKG
jgi:hypothetical protein